MSGLGRREGAAIVVTRCDRGGVGFRESTLPGEGGDSVIRMAGGWLMEDGGGG